MIASDEIYADFSAAAISQPAELPIFPNADFAAAFRRIKESPNATTAALGIKVELGQSVSWMAWSGGS
jgi:hypothetical protein